ncbi:MAG: aminotransferase class III-fold pyridoxal phosphate-dependent enzyme [Paracoccaceae bacterium]
MTSVANSPGLAATLSRLEDGFRAANPTSAKLHARACSIMPGGNTRAVLYYDPFPLTFVRGEGATVTDADGHTYSDYVGEYAAGLFGHSDPRLRAAINAALDDGVMLGGLNRHEAGFAEIIRDRFPVMERIRFTNSGTEANLFAIITARMATGRNDILVFDGGYHGGCLTYVGGMRPHDVPFTTHVARYNDIESVRALLEARGDAIACVVIELMMGAGGGITADPGFLSALRDETAARGIVLIFDEVVTSRMSGGGMQARLNVRPDMTTIGKYFGGGLGFGAFGGALDLMQVWDLTRGGIAHGGTFNNNTLSMAAGTVAIRDIFTPATAEALFERGEALAARLRALGSAHGVPLSVLGAGSVMTLHLQHRLIRYPSDLCTPPGLRKLLHLALLELGQSIGRRGYVTLSLPQSAQDDDRLVSVLDDVLGTHAAAILEGLEGT